MSHKLQKVSMIYTKRKKSAFDGTVKNTGMPKDNFWRYKQGIILVVASAFFTIYYHLKSNKCLQ